jgi:hypothetical protein
MGPMEHISQKGYIAPESRWAQGYPIVPYPRAV